MKYSSTFILMACSVLILLTSCNQAIRQGTELSENERVYLKDLGLLDDSERIILFDGQSDFETSGNFITDKRVASYWIDAQNDSKTSIDYGLYSEIDTILTSDLSHSLTYASYLEIVKHDGQTFKVYVDGDSTEVRTFFDRALLEWRIHNGG